MHQAIKEYQFRLDVQRFLWPVNYIALFIYGSPLFRILGVIIIEHNRTQDAHTRLVLQV